MPLCQRDLERSRRRALRGGDAGHDLDWSPGRPARRDLLAGAAEDHGVAALEPHHPLAGPGERDHQRVDLVLLAGWSVAGLADQHLLGLAPGEIEDLGRDEIVDENDVS